MLLLLTSSPARAFLGDVPAGGIVGGPTLNGLGAAAADEWESPFKLLICERDGTVVDELEDAFGRNFTRKLSDPGAGRFTIQADDPLAGIVGYGRVARFLIRGQARFAMLMPAIDRTALAQGEEPDQVIEVVGPGTLAILAEGIVGPGAGPVDNPDVRAFNVSTPGAADPTAWAPPQAPVSPPERPPANFPVSPPALPVEEPAQWVAGPPDAVGPLTYVATFEVPPDAVSMRVDVGSTGAANVMVDGILVARDPDDYRRQMVSAQLNLEEGTHTVAVTVKEPHDPALEPALIMRVSELDDGGKVTSSPTRTTVDDTAILETSGVVRSTNKPKPFTAGGILLTLIEEAQDRGCFPELTVDFAGDVDSLGEPWPALEEFTATVGDDSCLSVVRKFAELAVGWFEMAAGQMLLRGYATRPSLPSAALEPAEDGGTLKELKHEGAG